VALAIEAELERSGQAAVSLDMRAVDVARFPNIAAALEEVGIDPTRELVPVAPASHYTMGGVATDLDGRATLDGLLAVGECACTGLHGANRLASNSLAECFVLGRRAAGAAVDGHAVPAQPAGAQPARLPSPPSDASRAALWRHAGLRRDPDGLHRLATDPFPLARLIAAAALAREESRGAHQRIDHPGTDPALDGHHVVLGPGERVELQVWG